MLRDARGSWPPRGRLPSGGRGTDGTGYPAVLRSSMDLFLCHGLRSPCAADWVLGDSASGESHVENGGVCEKCIYCHGSGRALRGTSDGKTNGRLFLCSALFLVLHPCKGETCCSKTIQQRRRSIDIEQSVKGKHLHLMVEKNRKIFSLGGESIGSMVELENLLLDDDDKFMGGCVRAATTYHFLYSLCTYSGRGS